MKTVYVIDACALINAAQNYNMAKKSFAHIWEALDEMIQRGELISSVEIMDELKDDGLQSWAKQRKECFVPLTKEDTGKNCRSIGTVPDADKDTQYWKF